MTEVRDDQLPLGAGGADEVAVKRAASVMVVRGEPLEVLMMRRTHRSTFVPGAWIFPGGTVEPVDSEMFGADEETVLRVCASRELIEEVGILPDGGLVADDERTTLLGDPRSLGELIEPEDLERFVHTSRWVTPVGVPKRFDTWFFLLEVGSETEAAHDGIEGVDHLWIEPRVALDRCGKREMEMVFPTMKNLEAIAEAGSASELILSRRGVVPSVTRPLLIVDPEGRKQIVLPEEEA